MSKTLTKEMEARLDMLGITIEKIPIYKYKQYQYKDLSDALRYAEACLPKNDSDTSTLK